LAEQIGPAHSQAAALAVEWLTAAEACAVASARVVATPVIKDRRGP